MPESTATKNLFRLAGGLNTESNEINFPDGYTTSEANYEILIDGSRRRRRGLSAETGFGTAKTTETVELTSACNSYVWTNVEGDPDVSFIVTQVGSTLYFALDQETVSTSWITQGVDLAQFALTATLADQRDHKVTMSSGRGHLFVSGPYIHPFYVSYTAATGVITAVKINVAHRDYEGIDDGTDTTFQPTGTITASHRYNLRNRGWTETEMASVFGDLSYHPSRASVPAHGYVRTSDTTVGAGAIRPDDGIKAWSTNSAKFGAEIWGQSSAPMGSLFLNPMDTTYVVGNKGTVPIPITGWVVADEHASPWVVTVTAAAHGKTTPGDLVSISGNEYSFFYTNPVYPGVAQGTLNGTYAVIADASDDANTFTFNFTQVYWSTYFSAWVDQYKQYGQIGQASVVPLSHPGGSVSTDGFRAIEFHEGRVFYSGMGNKNYSDTIFFSKIALNPINYGQCHQEADPTDEEFNATTPADGGFMVIPGMGKVIDMVSQRNALLIFSKEGVWEIKGAQGGAFSATTYGVRKITDSGASSSSSITTVEGGIVYTGPAGIFVIAPNQYTGALEATNTSKTLVQTLWNQIPVAQQERVHAVYDESLRRMYFMYGANATSNLHTTMLVFDGNLGAYFKYTFNTSTDLGLIGGFAISNADDTSTNKKVKFIYQATATTIQIADFVHTDYLDFDGSAMPTPFMVTGWDNVGDFQKRKQAPVITVYQKKTETGYTSDGVGGLIPINPSSTTMQAYWDWTDATVSGKIGTAYQVYRHLRGYQPADVNDTFADGYPVVVTQNKVRGRGRVLSLRFEGTEAADSHILGFTTNYKVTR